MTWKERGCKCWSLMGKTLAITSSPSSIPPLNHHPPPSSRQPRRAWRNGAFEAPNFDLVLKPETEKRIPANQDVTDCLPKLFERSIVAVSINEIKKNWWRFFKKSGKQFLKKRKVKKKKRNSAEKRKIDIPVLFILLVVTSLVGCC